MAKVEREYQPIVIEKVRERLPGCLITKMSVPPGTPDLLIIWRQFWARLETKKSIHEKYQPNQEYYLDELNAMGFAKMICPENEHQVLDDMVCYLVDVSNRLAMSYEY